MSPESAGPLEGRPVFPAPQALGGYLTALIPLGLFVVVMMVVLSTRHWRMALFQVLPTTLVCVTVSGSVSVMLLRRTRASCVGVALVAGGAAWMAMLLMIALLAILYGRPWPAVWQRPLVLRGLTSAPALGAMVGWGLWMLECARQRAEQAWHARHAMQGEQERLAHENVLSQLQLLQAQVEPHFIYNTLANLRQLLRRGDPETSLRLLDQLIHYFKGVLPTFRARFVTLRDELSLATTYVNLMGMRMGRAIELVVDVPQDTASLMLIPGAILCFVENSIKHGLPASGSVRLVVQAEHGPHSLTVRVRDQGNGPACDADDPSTGTGLRNLRERLRLTYAGRAHVGLRHTHPGCEATLTVPLMTPTELSP